MNNWQKYNLGLIFKPPHVEVKNEVKKIKASISLLKGVLFARWTSDFDCNKNTEFWYVIKDGFEGFEELSSNTRSKTRRGLKKFDVELIDRSLLKDLGYRVYESAFKRYQTHMNPLNKKQFQNELENQDSSWEYWGVFDKKTSELVAYSQNQILDKSCDYSRIKLNPNFLKFYPSYALFYKMNEYYLSEKKFKYVNDGARSISHETNIQSFLVDKFKFRKAYCKLHLEYSIFIKLFLDIVKPFERIFDLVPLNLFKKVSILIKQEKIRKSFE
mgnify:CR=1 FL=1|tara:strand:- start:2082 stop:2897 length:816 start_codon:yes stop_codon:yes gene_type:complete